jgi:hypothetical protein
MQGKKLGFSWIPLAENGLFQRVTLKKIKKTSFHPTTRSGCKTGAQRPLWRF